MENSDAPSVGPRDRRPDALGDLQVLPDEVICAILEFLTPRDVARVACVSRFSSLSYPPLLLLWIRFSSFVEIRSEISLFLWRTDWKIFGCFVALAIRHDIAIVESTAVMLSSVIVFDLQCNVHFVQ